ncbi:MAG: 23S rRNA (guanosine(2251)-2'-O)-methyltransferase RlmB [Candidatus Omnitrophica bacterium]|nr:23S rRNA (guanosine(2251)-2'-O)-methyltransferase RlmB [Candidatus Omnitrophota bacterium]MDE2222391.1 23S rRNA (guanosine(2251)-2'-O)-methyltransferase RlmB [Candidatus Omnitrophota bacterium]
MKLYGKNPVIERLKSNPKSIQRILIDEHHADLSYIRKKCHQWGISVATVPHSKIQRMAQNLNTQGILAEIGDFVYVPIDELLQQALDKKRTPVFLDNLNDPQNLGGIIRSCGALGDFDIVIPTTESVGITESVLRVACGGENYLSVARVSNLGHAIERAKKMGFWIVGTVVEGAGSLTSAELQFPLGLVMGSEEKGVRDIILKKLDMQVMVPMKNQRMSLNVAHATSMLCYEIIRQKKQKSLI